MATTLLVATSCASSGSGAGLPPPPSTMDVTMREFRFEHPPQVAAGRVSFRLHNAGSLTHELILVALPESLPPIGEQLRSEAKEAVDTLVTVRDQPPGTSTPFASDLAPGRYAFICFVRDPDGLPHYEKGMSSEIRVS